MAPQEQKVTECPHKRTEPWRKGPVEGGPERTITIAKETLRRSWTVCLDCGVRLERALVDK